MRWRARGSMRHPFRGTFVVLGVGRRWVTVGYLKTRVKRRFARYRHDELCSRGCGVGCSREIHIHSLGVK